MAYKVVISDEAKIDLKEHYLYYKKAASKKVADGFFNDFDSTRKAIAKSPYFRIWFDNFRAVPLKKYPFIVFYLISSDNIILIARIFHTSQNPEKYPISKV
ncbi:MAG: type II toxin-antitoxin system RelE/ParE family toxin [Pedobacter sp.]